MGTPQYTLNSTKLWQSQGTEGVKKSEECELNLPSEFHGCASACSSKCEGRGLGISIDLVLLSMELSGNLIQYESGSDAGWSIVPVFHELP